MTNTQLANLFESKSQEWRDGFFAAVNLNTMMKAAFLNSVIQNRDDNVTEHDVTFRYQPGSGRIQL